MKTKLCLSILAARAKTTLLLSLTLGLFGTLLQAAPTSVSELLEQGIYSEETKGDLNAAMRLYEQVVKEARSGEALAAQAQYRIGLCYYKKKDFAAATAAFEKLIAEYPSQKQLVAQATEYLAGAAMLQPTPWTSGEELRLDVQTQTGFKVGFVKYTAVADQLNGKQIWRLGSHLTAAGAQQASRVEVDADNLKPIHSRWRHSVIGEADTTYSAGHAELRLLGKDSVQDVDLGGVCYDNEEAVQMIRRLPLGTNYSTTLRIFTGLSGGAIIPFRIDVQGIETIEVPAGKFECYKIKFSIVNQTFWYSTDAHRYLVQFEAGPILAKLTQVGQVEPAEWIKQANAEFEFALGTPDTVPTIESQNAQTPMLQAKSLILMAAGLKTLPDAGNWCETLNAGGARMPAVPTNTIFAMNREVAGRAIRSLPSDTVVFFETTSGGWNRAGGAELIAKKPTGTAVAFADGRALLIDPAELNNLHWSPE